MGWTSHDLVWGKRGPHKHLLRRAVTLSLTPPQKMSAAPIIIRYEYILWACLQWWEWIWHGHVKKCGILGGVEKYIYMTTHTLSRRLNYIQHQTCATWTPHFWESDILWKNRQKHTQTPSQTHCDVVTNLFGHLQDTTILWTMRKHSQCLGRVSGMARGYNKQNKSMELISSATSYGTWGAWNGITAVHALLCWCTTTLLSAIFIHLV